MKMKCLLCGNEELEPGKIQSTGRLYFRPKAVKFLNLKTANIVVESYLCKKCGYIMLAGHKGKTKSLRMGNKENPA